MKKVLKNNKKTKKYLEGLQKIYYVGLWANYGIREYPFTGKCNKEGIPLIYEYCDDNGTCDEYRLMPITHTTTGWIKCICYGKQAAEQIADAMNDKYNSCCNFCEDDCKDCIYNK